MPLTSSGAPGDPPAPATPSPALAAPFLPASPRHGSILIVEDRDDVRLGLAELLELNGFHVVDAATAEEAIASLTAQPDGFALVLLDLLLPGMSGSDLRARQLADPSLAEIPTVVVTASDTPPLAYASLKPAAWIEKPFHCDSLLQLVRQYVVPDGPT